MFELTEDQTMIRDMVRRFASDVVREEAHAWNDARALPSGIFRQLFDLGLLAATVPGEDGGSELDAVSFALVLEELAREDASLALVVASHDAALELIPDERADVAGVGEVVSLAVGGIVSGGDRLSRVVTSDGLRSLPQADAIEAHGMEAAGLLKIDATAEPTDAWRRNLAAVAVGVARGALEEATAYAKEREQFGKPISAFQAIQFKIAEMATAVDAARLLALGAANGHVDAAAALRFAAKTARTVTDEAVQIHGGYGYVREYPVERYYRDARWFGLWVDS